MFDRFSVVGDFFGIGLDITARVDVFFRWRRRCVRQVGDDERRPANLRRLRRNGFARLHFVAAGDQPRFAFFHVFGIERELEQRFEIQPAAC